MQCNFSLCGTGLYGVSISVVSADRPPITLVCQPTDAEMSDVRRFAHVWCRSNSHDEFMKQLESFKSNINGKWAQFVTAHPTSTRHHYQFEVSAVKEPFVRRAIKFKRKNGVSEHVFKRNSIIPKKK